MVIIRYPTGLYSTVVPQHPYDAGNVSWTMSQPPPKLTQIFPKMPGIHYRSKLIHTITLDARRNAWGGIIYSVTTTSRSELGSATKQYVTGQLLSFSDLPATNTPQVLPLPSTITDIQHGLNQLDYTSLGLTTDQQAIIESASNAAYKQTQTAVATARERYLSLQVLINEDQKIINETITAIAALQVLAINNPSIASMISTLQTTQLAAQTRIDNNITAVNLQATEITDLQDRLANLSQLVR